MKGWLVVNSFLDSNKFKEIYVFLKNAADKYNVLLEIKSSSSILCDTESFFSSYHLPDFVLFWDKDIYLAQRLEAIHLPVFNSARAIEICDNKILTALCLAGKVKTPKTIIAPKTFEGVNYNNLDFLDYAINCLKFPIVIKEAYGSFGQQVYLAHTLEEAQGIINKLGHKDFLMQEYISSSHGRDVRINVVGGKVISAMLRNNPEDFRSNISNGGKMSAYNPSVEQQAIAIQACEAIGLSFAGVDILFGVHEEPIVCEVNSNPHFKSSFDSTGIDLSLNIMEYIINQLKLLVG